MSPLLLALPLLCPAALATDRFDPLTPAASYTDTETYDQAGELKLWSAVERLEDADRTLFTQEPFNEAIAWPAEADWAPWIADCFDSTTPHSSNALLHVGLNESVSSGTPILLVPGAGDNGVRAFVTMGTRLDRTLRPVYALTFAHAHGDVFQQAEAVANAINRIKARTGADRIDVVSHSKGGIATAVYLANDGSGSWSSGTGSRGGAYDSVGTTYRDDVRRAVFIATPLGGIDSSFRWPATNYASLDTDAALSPSSWSVWYPYTTANPYVTQSLNDQHIGGTGLDIFPGHRQLLARWDDVYALPGEQTWLGSYALQPDWWTTYYGGLGAQSWSDGIDQAIETGGNLIDTLAARGVDPDVEIFLLAGENPLMPNGTDDWLAGSFDGAWLDASGEIVDSWSDMVTDAVGNGLTSVGITEGELAGLVGGDLVLGDISGPSDGLVFVDSATDASALTARGAVVVETKTVDLSHIDLLYASDITGALLIEEAGDDDDLAWMVAVGERYTEANTLAWVEAVLADDAGGSDTGTADGGATDDGTADGGTTDGGLSDGGSSDDTGAGSADDTGDALDGNSPSGGCGRCASTTAPAIAGWGLLLGLAGLVRRRR